MKILLSRKWLPIILVTLLSLASSVKGQGDEEKPLDGFLNSLREKYDALPDTGKFATGAAIGFGGSRIVVKSAVGVVKVAGAAFVASEVLNAAGVLDDIPSFSDEQVELAENIKRRALSAAHDFRKTVRHHLNPDQIRTFMDTEKMCAIGAATGAMVGFIF